MVAPVSPAGFVQRLSPEALDAGQARLRAEYPELATPPRAPTIENAGVGQAIAGVRILVFRGARYRVPPVPYAHGIALQALQGRLSALAGEPETEATLQQLLALLEEAAARFRALVTPVGLITRLTWRWRTNPFWDASEDELATLLAFFFACRRTSTVEVAGPEPWARATQRGRSMRRTASRNSSARSRRGAMPPGFPAPGRTT